MPETPSTPGWEKTKIISGIIAAIFVPSAIAYFGHQYNSAIKEREIQGRFVELSIDILRAETKDMKKIEPLRKWATEVINNYSGVPLSSNAISMLVSGQPLPSVGNSRGVTINNVPNNDPSTIEMMIRGLKDHGATDVIVYPDTNGTLKILGIDAALN